MKLSEQLRQDAILAGLCQNHIDKWGEMSVEQLIAYYKANPDWCLERNFPTISFMNEHFKTNEVMEMGVYINQKDMKWAYALPKGNNQLIFNNCTGRLTIDEWSVARIFVGLDSHLEITVKDNACLILDYYDTSAIKVINKSKGKVNVYQYGVLAPKLKGNEAIYKLKYNEKTL